MPCARFIGFLALVLPLLTPPARAQSAPAAQAEAAPAPAPPTRQWVLSTTPFALVGGLTPTLRVERVIGPHFTALLDGAFSQSHSRSFGRRWRTTSASLGVGVRYYLAGRAPKGLYAEGVVHGRLYQVRRWPAPRYTSTRLASEVGIGYQFLFGRQRRVALDVGMRLNLTPLIYRPAHYPQRDHLTLELIPAFRVGVAF